VLTSRSPDNSPQARFEALLNRHRGIVHKVAATYCRHPEDRRDLAQQITEQLWVTFGRYDPDRPFSTWAYRVALNVAISHVRHASLRHRTVESYDAHDHEPVDAETLSTDDDDRVRALYQVVDRLGAFDRALLLLHLEGYRHAEIAAILGLSATNVSTRLSRLRKQIQTDLAPTGPPPADHTSLS
jgi:RNA polymerase sigma-70 factor (ECF subfamily)